MADHTTAQEEERGCRRWACTCGWATKWTRYTDPGAGPAAIRHIIASSEETQP